MTQLTRGGVLDNFEQLENYLKNWRSFSDQQIYDPNGMMALLCACIANLRSNVQEQELEDLGSILTDDEKTFLQKLLSS